LAGRLRSGRQGRADRHGDRKHLLPIGSHQGIAIVTALEVVERLEARGKT